MPYYVFVPPGYDGARDARYPVLYMLHGMGGSNIEWLGYGLAKTAEGLMRAGEIPPFLIVLPQGDQSYWMDHAYGGPKWASYTALEVVAEIDARYRTLPERRYRGIGGLSMGADGALQIALNHPDVFGVAGAHSPFLRRESEALTFFGGGADYAERDPWSLALTRPEVARTLSLWIDVGDADERRSVVVGFHRDLEDAGIQHAWREYIGSHSEEYWGGYAPHYLRYYAAMFCGVEDDPRQRRIDIGASCPPYPSQRR
jgi:enterochelin esterase-like enzyme